MLLSTSGTQKFVRRFAKQTAQYGKPSRLRHLSSLGDDNRKSVVGFLGLGNMGLPMALNLAKTRHVIAFDPSTVALDKAMEGGVMACDSVYDVGKEANIIVTMLPGCDFVNSVMKPLVDATKDKKTLFVDCSTVSPTTSRYWHEKVSEDGHEMYASPNSANKGLARTIRHCGVH